MSPDLSASAAGTALDEDALRDLVRRELAGLLGVAPAEIGDGARFAALGLDSPRAVRFAGRLAEVTGTAVPVTVLWSHPSVAALARRLADGPDTRPATADPRPAEAPAPVRDEPIAVIGMACRFPGADDLGAFWRLLTSGADAVGPVPPGRWEPGTAGTGVPDEAGFLTGPVDAFDPLFFGISPREAAEMDPQQRLFLEVAWEALEHAGLAPDTLAGTRTGVFAGAIWHDFADLRGRDGQPPTSHSATGRALNMVANRVSYVLGLRGPSLTVDSACSSSLLAIHLACRSLRDGESRTALAGGVNLLLDPETMRSLTRFGGLSPDGRCKAFDAAGDGFGRGEGCGIVVLKPLSLALADGDRVWCLINGSAVNNDGPSNGLTAPDPLAQEDVLRRAHRNAGVSPGEIHFVETHGTGTALGDPVEAAALGAVCGTGRTDPLVIGAVKTNIGHLEGAAGVAGVIKTALCLHHAALPPNLHFTDPNPHIDFDALRLRVPTSVEAWPEERPYAGVSSFGWGGTNVHLVLGRWREPEPSPAVPAPVRGGDGHRPRVAFVCSPHGHQWAGMGRRMLRTEPVFRAALDDCDRALAPFTGRSVLEDLHAPDGARRYEDVAVVQPILFAVQVALAAWLEHRGVVPDVVTGHSLGEIPAAVIAGFLDVPEAARLVHHYSRHQARIAGRGEGMAVVELPAGEVAGLLPASSPLVIAAHNGPRSTALAGPVAHLTDLLAALKARDVLCSMVKVGVAAHSPAVDEIAEDLIADLGDLAAGPGRLPMISTLTAAPVTAADLTAEYFARNLRRPVRLAEVTAGLLDDGCDVLVELSAHPVLLPALRESARLGRGDARVLPTMTRGEDDRTGPLDTLAGLAALGAVRDAPHDTGSAELLILSAADDAALRATAAAAAKAVADLPPESMPELAAEARRRARLPHRLALAARSPADAAAVLRDHADGVHTGRLHTATVAARRPKTVFVFPGQGSQWPGMGRELLAAEPVFAAAIRRCDAAAAPHLDWSILDELRTGRAGERAERIDVVQPLLFAMEVALAELWQSWGVRPDAVVGHSMGEAAAACVAGAVRLEDAARVICLRSRLMHGRRGRGAMLAVELTAEEAAAAVGGHRDLVSVAVANSRRSTVLSGDPDRLREIAERLTDEEVFCRRVKVDVASHSPQMDALKPDLLECLAGVSGRDPRIPMHSTVTGGLCTAKDFGPSYWFDNLRAPVLFGDRIEHLIADGHTVFVELSPHPVLLPAVRDAARYAGEDAEVCAVPSLRRAEPARDVLLDSLGALCVRGVPAEPERAARPARPSAVLPAHPWRRERFEIRRGGGPARADEPVLGERLDPVEEPGVHYWRPLFGPDGAACADHVVGGAVTAPGGLVVDWMIQAARQVLPAAGHELTRLRFRAPVIAGESGRRLQLSLRRDAAGRRDRMRLFDADACAAEASVRELPPGRACPRLDVADVERRLAGGEDPAGFYRRLSSHGLHYGPEYRRVTGLCRSGAETVARVEPGGTRAEGHLLDPRLLDAALHSALAPVLGELPDGTGPVAAGIGHCRVHGPLDGPALVHASTHASGRGFRADVRVHGLDGALLVEAAGVVLAVRRLGGAPEPLPAAGDAPPAAEAVLAAVLRLPDDGRRRTAVEEHVAACVAGVARTAADRIEPEVPLRAYGVDSLMLLELRDRLAHRFGVRLTPAVIARNPTVRLLAPLIAEPAGIPLSDPLER